MGAVTVKVIVPTLDFPDGSKIVVDFCDKIAVSDLLDRMTERYGERFREAIIDKGSDSLRPAVGISVNHIHINFLRGLQTPLKNGDVIMIFSFLSGG